MTIEFHAPHGKVKEWVIDYLKNKLVQLHHINAAISRAEVYFKEDNTPGQEKICEIDLTIYGESLFTRRSAGSYEEASREAADALAADIARQTGGDNELPDKVTSTVKV